MLTHRWSLVRRRGWNLNVHLKTLPSRGQGFVLLNQQMERGENLGMSRAQDSFLHRFNSKRSHDPPCRACWQAFEI